MPSVRGLKQDGSEITEVAVTLSNLLHEDHQQQVFYAECKYKTSFTMLYVLCQNGSEGIM